MKTFRHTILAILCISLMVVFLSQSDLRADDKAEPRQVLGHSPNGAITIQRKHAGEMGQYVEFLDTKTGRGLFSYHSVWRSTDLVWEKSGRYLCINDETATSGDFIYIFKIGHDNQVTLLRAPSLEDFSSNLSDRLSKMPDPGRFTFTGKKWLNKNQLLAVVSGGHYGNSSFETVLQINEDGGIEIIKPKPAY